MSFDPPPPGASQPGEVRLPPPAAPQPPVPEGSKSYIVTLLLSYFLGFFGADRFYLGKTRSALAKLFTLGGFGYWWLIDIFITLFGGQRDAWGFRLNGYARYKKTVWIVIGAIFAGSFALSVVITAVSASFDQSGPTVFGWVLAAVLTIGGATAGAIWYFRRRARVSPRKAKRGADPLPGRIRALVDRIGEIRTMYVVRAASGDEVAARLVGLIDSLLSDTTELFARLAAKADKDERVRAEQEYDDKLGKLAKALDRDYLWDVIVNPRFWDEPDQRVRDVQSAMEAVNAQLLDNIRQVNAHKGLVFKVAVGGLIGPRKDMDDWQRDFDRASGPE